MQAIPETIATKSKRPPIVVPARKPAKAKKKFWAEHRTSPAEKVHASGGRRGGRKRLSWRALADSSALTMVTRAALRSELIPPIGEREGP